MGGFVKGEVVVIPFPFSDLSNSKRRPALVIAPLQGSDLILCMMTSQHTKDSDALLLRDADFSHGRLQRDSYIRPNRLFTADAALIIRRVGQLSPSMTQQVIDKLIAIITR